MKAFMVEKQIEDNMVQRCQIELPYETGAFERLMMLYQDKVYGKVLSMIRNQEEAADLTQDVFVKVFHALPSFRRDASFSTWLYTITVNTCLNHLDKMQHRPWWGLADDVDEVRVDVLHEVGLYVAAGHMVEQTELREMIDQVMSMMRDTAREIIHLRYFEEQDYRSMADRLGIGLSATKMRLKRAREEFKQCFDRLSEQNEAGGSSKDIVAA